MGGNSGSFRACRPSDGKTGIRMDVPRRRSKPDNDDTWSFASRFATEGRQNSNRLKRAGLDFNLKFVIRRRGYSGNQFQRLIAHVIPAIGETGNHVGSSSNDLPLIFLARSTQTLNKNASDSAPPATLPWQSVSVRHHQGPSAGFSSRLQAHG